MRSFPMTQWFHGAVSKLARRRRVVYAIGVGCCIAGRSPQPTDSVPSRDGMGAVRDGRARAQRSGYEHRFSNFRIRGAQLPGLVRV